MSRSPIDMLIDQTSMRCTKCGAQAGACDCWERCSCGWSAEKGKPCGNPKTTKCSTKVKYGVTLRCPACHREAVVERHHTDPPAASVVQATCNKCDQGDFAEALYFDKASCQVLPED